MNELTAHRDYQRAAALRRATFDLLEQHTRRGLRESDPSVITALQDAANRLGSAEGSLREKAGSGHRSTQPEPPTGPSDAAHPRQEPPLSRSAAITLALAETLVPLAPSRADEAERWLRIMREHGHVGNALEELGMASGVLSTPASEPPRRYADRTDPVTTVAGEATRFARDRDGPAVSTVDVLFAVILHYGPLFDRALYSATSKPRSDLLLALSQPERVA